MLELAYAKINLLLSVKPGADAGGYHAVRTVLCPLELCDEVEVSPLVGSAPELVCLPPVTADPTANLAYRAAMAMAGRFGRSPAVRIVLRKRIPSQAGLGGGSSDAAAVLRALATLWQIDPNDGRLQEVAASLGADVPFFLRAVPTLLGGRGDVPQAFFRPFSMPVALVKPRGGVSTSDAYRMLDELAPAPADPAAMVAALEAGDVSRALDALSNNMEAGALRLRPELRDVFRFLADAPGCEHGPLLCGSGSCVAAFTGSDEAAAALARGAETRGWWGCATRTLG